MESKLKTTNSFSNLWKLRTKYTLSEDMPTEVHIHQILTVSAWRQKVSELPFNFSFNLWHGSVLYICYLLPVWLDTITIRVQFNWTSSLSECIELMGVSPWADGFSMTTSLRDDYLRWLMVSTAEAPHIWDAAVFCCCLACNCMGNYLKFQLVLSLLS